MNSAQKITAYVLVALGALMVPLCPAWAQRDPHLDKRGTSSGEINATSATVIKSSAGAIYSISVVGDGGTGWIALYDNATAASGTVLADVASATNDKSESIVFSVPLMTDNGIVAQVGGTGAVVRAYVVYE